MARAPRGGRPLVSVALAAYNGQRFLAQQLDSIVGQTYRPLEVIVSDDGSLDATMSIARGYAQRYPGLVRCRQNERNLGCAGNFAAAISLCTGDLLALSDQDDIWDPDKLERLVAAIGDRDLAYSDARVVNEAGAVIHPSLRRFAALPVSRTTFPDLLACNTVTGCTALVTRSLADRALPFPSSIPHDMWLALLAADGRGISYVRAPLLSYRQHGANAIGAHRAGARIGGVQARGKSWKSFRARQEELYRRDRENLVRIARESGAALTACGRKQLDEHIDYYASYFSRRVRWRAFLYYGRHFRSMRGKQSILRGLIELLLSLIGRGRE